MRGQSYVHFFDGPKKKIEKLEATMGSSKKARGGAFGSHIRLSDRWIVLLGAACDRQVAIKTSDINKYLSWNYLFILGLVKSEGLINLKCEVRK